jgi:hypothetical protein
LSPASSVSYELVTANGITEVLERRRDGDIVHLNDDPTVRQQLEVLAGRKMALESPVRIRLAATDKGNLEEKP